jgi:hypothetical protein
MSDGPIHPTVRSSLSVLRADEGFVEALAEVVAARIVDHLEPGRDDGEEAYLDTEGAARHLCASRRRIHELTSAGLLRPDGYDGRRPLFRRASLDLYVRGGRR